MSFTFDGVEEAKIIGQAQYTARGTYRCEVLACKEGKKPGTQIKMLLIELKVKEATPDSVYKPGDEFTHSILEASDYFLGDVKQFAAAVTNKPLDAITKANLVEMISEKQPARGRTVDLVAWEKPLRSGPTEKNKSGMFTKARFESAAANDAKRSLKS